MTRSATEWHSVVDCLGRTVLFVTSDECTVNAVGICSIRTPGSTEPSHRIVADDTRGWHAPCRVELDPEADAPYPEMGLIVLGTSKYSRPDLLETVEMPGINGLAAVLAVIEQRGARLDDRLRLRLLAKAEAR